MGQQSTDKRNAAEAGGGRSMRLSAGGVTATSGGAVYRSVLDMIGRTPMLELRKLDVGPCRLFVKMELLNPAGSIKDRIGLSMIEAAERDGTLIPDPPKGMPPPTIIEATAGNTGLGLALVAGQKGYRLKVVMPDKMSQEKIQHLRAMGAEVILTRSDVQKGHPEYYQDVAARLASQTPNSVFINQFCNPANVEAHYTTTGPEIWEQMGGNVDAVVVGVGSGGTLSGVGRYLREMKPDVKIILSDPAGSVLHPLVNEGKKVEAGAWLVEGMGEDFVPDICDIDLVDEAIPVTDGEAFMAARELLVKEGVLAGSSTGCLIAAAVRWCRRQTKPMNVVTFACDTGAKYLSKCFNDFWMIDNGFIQRPGTNDLRDLIARRHSEREDYTLKEDDPVKQAIRRMELYGVSQMAVMDARDRVVGILDESDILLAVVNEGGGQLARVLAGGSGPAGAGAPAGGRGRSSPPSEAGASGPGNGAFPSVFERPVSDFMTRRLETIRPTASVNDLMPIFRADRVAIVVDDNGVYHGLITKIDLIHYLRQKVGK